MSSERTKKTKFRVHRLLLAKRNRLISFCFLLFCSGSIPKQPWPQKSENFLVRVVSVCHRMTWLELWTRVEKTQQICKLIKKNFQKVWKTESENLVVKNKVLFVLVAAKKKSLLDRTMLDRNLEKCRV
jgi:hypothetical protein